MDFKETTPVIAAQKAYDRRQFIESAGKGIIAATVVGGISAAATASAEPIAENIAGNPGPMSAAIKVVGPNQHAASEGERTNYATILPKDKRVGYAIVGLGELALEAILPGFGSAKTLKWLL